MIRWNNDTFLTSSDYQRNEWLQFWLKLKSLSCQIKQQKAGMRVELLKLNREHEALKEKLAKVAELRCVEGLQGVY